MEISLYTFITCNLFYVGAFTFYRLLANHNYNTLEDSYDELYEEYIYLLKKYDDSLDEYDKIDNENKNLKLKMSSENKKILKEINRLKQKIVDDNADLWKITKERDTLQTRCEVLEEECKERKFSFIKLRRRKRT
jgi:seryl-tRNA synthetase